jgi:hypothetical protein
MPSYWVQYDKKGLPLKAATALLVGPAYFISGWPYQASPSPLLLSSSFNCLDQSPCLGWCTWGSLAVTPSPRSSDRWESGREDRQTWVEAPFNKI